MFIHFLDKIFKAVETTPFSVILPFILNPEYSGIKAIVVLLTSR